MARATNQAMWLQVPALDVSETQAPSDCLSCYNTCLEHYRACKRAHAGGSRLKPKTGAICTRSMAYQAPRIMQAADLWTCRV